MSLRAVFLVSAYREIIHAYGLYFSFSQKFRSFVRDVDKVRQKLMSGPFAGRIAGFEQQLFIRLQIVALQFLHGNLFLVLNLDDARPPHDRAERQGIDGSSICKKVQRRVHVGARVNAHADTRDIVMVASRQIVIFCNVKRCVAGPVRHTGLKRR